MAGQLQLMKDGEPKGLQLDRNQQLHKQDKKWERVSLREPGWYTVEICVGCKQPALSTRAPFLPSKLSLFGSILIVIFKIFGGSGNQLDGALFVCILLCFHEVYKMFH